MARLLQCFCNQCIKHLVAELSNKIPPNLELRKIMKQFKLLIAFLCAFCTHFYTQAQAQTATDSATLTYKIAYVDSDRVFKESVLAKAAQYRVEQEFAPQAKAIEAQIKVVEEFDKQFQSDSPTLAESELKKRRQELEKLDRELAERQQQFNVALNKRREEELATLLEKANRLIKQFAESGHYDLIVQDAIYNSPRIDITDQILRLLDQEK